MRWHRHTAQSRRESYPLYKSASSEHCWESWFQDIQRQRTPAERASLHRNPWRLRLWKEANAFQKGRKREAQAHIRRLRNSAIIEMREVEEDLRTGSSMRELKKQRQASHIAVERAEVQQNILRAALMREAQALIIMRDSAQPAPASAAVAQPPQAAPAPAPQPVSQPVPHRGGRRRRGRKKKASTETPVPPTTPLTPIQEKERHLGELRSQYATFLQTVELKPP
jgi:uncharacterized membrane protein YccC